MLRDQPPQHRGVVARKVLDMRGMAPGPAGEQPVLGQVLDEIRAGGHLPLRQRAQDIGPHEALGRLQDGKAPGAVVLGVVPLVVAWAIPALLEDAVGAALGHALGHELVRRRARRKAEADRWCLHRRVSLWARCSSRARVWLLAFAVAAIGELVAKPAGAAGVALVPAHRDLVLGTPARVGVALAGRSASGGWWRRRRGALLRVFAVGTGGLRLHGGGHGRGDLLVERPGLGLTLLLGLLAAALGLLLAGSRGWLRSRAGSPGARAGSWWPGAGASGRPRPAWC